MVGSEAGGRRQRLQRRDLTGKKWSTSSDVINADMKRLASKYAKYGPQSLKKRQDAGSDAGTTTTTAADGSVTTTADSAAATSAVSSSSSTPSTSPTTSPTSDGTTAQSTSAGSNPAAAGSTTTTPAAASSTAAQSSSSRTSDTRASTTYAPTTVVGTTEIVQGTLTRTLTTTNTSTPSAAATSSASLTGDNSGSSGGLSTGTTLAIAIPVAIVGALILLGLLLFGLSRWRKRNALRYNPSEDEIKWPEVASNPDDQAALYPTAVRPTGRAGIDMGEDGEETLAPIIGAGAMGAAAGGLHGRQLSSSSNGYGTAYNDTSASGHSPPTQSSHQGWGAPQAAGGAHYDPQAGAYAEQTQPWRDYRSGSVAPSMGAPEDRQVGDFGSSANSHEYYQSPYGGYAASDATSMSDGRRKRLSVTNQLDDVDESELGHSGGL
ncbi:uncharacterized protein L969DRAFT_19702 [Mixia osmundae IAM 14324]|uniref:uncharacterized protein n=1 Tax=Mixia osmundae (strain CBS 9802 / IAM 14324 / JCM 22182 / KY 12970) TaxID=764103 RepID=UPI0004A552EE|nr:uncharacterized protein L969DRAFT_19702 [Mixia osmundae IAM 14324]KEI37167.1 hypothetical protein L969DRAFT_19702 [Mixia osmundae IAM 14324]